MSDNWHGCHKSSGVLICNINTPLVLGIKIFDVLYRFLPWPISVTQPIYKIHRLICKLYHSISTHFILFASYIVLFQLMLSYLQAVSSYFNSCRLICSLSPPIFKLHNLISSFCIILFSSLTSSYLQLLSSYLQLIL